MGKQGRPGSEKPSGILGQGQRSKAPSRIVLAQGSRHGELRAKDGWAWAESICSGPCLLILLLPALYPGLPLGDLGWELGDLRWISPDLGLVELTRC